MKLRWVLLLVVVVAGAGLSYRAVNPGRDRDTDSLDEPPKDKRQASGENTSKKKTGAVVKKKAAELGEEKKPADEYRLPDDSGGRLVSRVTGPPARLPEAKQVAPLRRPAPRSVEDPSLPLPPQEVLLPRLPATASRRPARPELVVPEPLFGLEE